MEDSAAKVQQLETLFSDVDGGLTTASGAEMEAALRATEELLDDLRDDAQLLTGNYRPHTHTHTCKVTSLTRTTSPTGLEKRLQGRLSSISRSQLTNGQDVQNIAEAADDVKQQQQMYETKVEEVQTLMEEMRRKLEKAEADLRSAVSLQLRV